MFGPMGVYRFHETVLHLAEFYFILAGGLCGERGVFNSRAQY
jgi:hypothetical protein